MQQSNNQQAQTSSRSIADDTSSYTIPSNLSILNFFRVIRRRKLPFLLTIVIINIFVVWLTAQITPKYTATSQIMIEARQPQVINLESVVEELPVDVTAIDTQIRFLRSSLHASRVVEKLGLLSDHEFNPTVQKSAHTDEAGPLSIAKNWLLQQGLLKSAESAGSTIVEDMTELEHRDKEQQREAAVSAFLKNLSVKQQGISLILSIQFTSIDAQKAADIANATAEIYVANQLQEELNTTETARTWLSNKADIYRQQVISADQAVEEYRNSHSLLGGDQHEIDRLSSELLELSGVIEEKKAKLEKFREISKNGTEYMSMPEISASPIELSTCVDRKPIFCAKKHKCLVSMDPAIPLFSI